jgi:hypothetical protein
MRLWYISPGILRIFWVARASNLIPRVCCSAQRPPAEKPTLLSPEEGENVVVQFFAERTLDMQTIDGAVEALHNIGKSADVIMLSNLPHEAGDDRRANLAGHGLNFPVVTNSGPKGPAIHKIATQITAPVVFIDDSPGFITSAFHHAPDVHLIHFLHDERYARLGPLDFVSLRTDTWEEAPHVLKLIGELTPLHRTG